MEKFAIAKSKLFLEQNNRLTLPSLELIYMWNGFRILGSRYETIEQVFILVEKAIREHEKDKGISMYYYAANFRFNNPYFNIVMYCKIINLYFQTNHTKMRIGVSFFYFAECASNT